jgi:hypothetical protein
MIANRRTPGATSRKFESLANQIGVLQRQAGDVATWSRQGSDQTGAERVVRHWEDNRDDRCRLLCREDGCDARRDDDIDLEPDELGRDLGVSFGASLGPAIRDRKVAIFGPTEFTQPLHKRRRHVLLG